jgi:esterase
MLTALRFPEVVERLVVVDAAPVAYPPAFGI